MAFFDEPRPSRVPGAAAAVHAGRWLRGAPAVVFAWFVALLIVAAIAVGASVASLEAVERVADAAARTELTVFLPADAPRADAEAVRARIAALPGIASARLVAKEDAFAALGLERVPALQGRSLPLADAVVARLRWTRPIGPSPGTALTMARAALGAAAPGATVDYDPGWAGTLDAWSARIAAVDAAAQPAIVALAALAALAVAFVAGRACRGVPGTTGGSPGGTGGAAVLVGAVAGGLAAVLAWYGFCAAVTISRIALVAMQPTGPIAGLIPSPWQWAIVAVVVAASVVGFATGTRRTDESIR